MINNWEIFSNIDPSSSEIRYSLLMDGSEQDARLMARKLKQYVKPPRPALAPYIYSFPLPSDLDEDTLEKIRQIVQQTIVHAQQVNELMPGGTFATQLYKPGAEQEDKAFPTFLTLDPSESEFTDHSSNKTVPIPTPEEYQEQPLPGHKVIDLNDFDKTIRSIAQTFQMQQPQEPKKPLPPIPPLPEEPHTREISLTFSQTPPPPPTEEKTFSLPPANKTSTHMAQIDLSFSTTEPLVPAEKEQAPQQPQALVAPQSPADTTPQPPVAPTTKPVAPPPPKVELGDIFSAETKYDMFMDLEKEFAQSKKPATPQAASKSQAPQPPKATDFNIFEQKMKDQTCFMDINEVAAVTEHITEKDLSFVEHAKIAPQDKDLADLPDMQPMTPPTPPTQPTTPSWPSNEENTAQEVMDPFEQLLAANTSKTQTTQPAQPQTPAQAPTEPSQPPQPPVLPAAPATQPLQEPTPQPPAVEEEVAEHGITKELEEVFGPQTPMENNTMTENTGETRKTFLRLKRKEQPTQPGATPVPPTPAAPKPPMSGTPAEPQEEVHPTILRRKRMVNPLEKTTTIDHSIQVPLSELKKYNWPIEVPLVPTYTLENMTISVNRFAHATAISVIENPGKLYNPLVLHGSGGTGKTHFLHAIGYALSKKFGQENVFITNGVRLSRGIQRYIMEGNIKQFEQFTSSVRALLIDDIHLISINEQNRAYLSKLLNDFRDQHKQIVITSKYPPENLAKLEELLKFKLDSGWISDLKQAQGSALMRIIQKMLINNSIDITNDDAQRFFVHPHMSLGTVARSIRRVRVLERVMQGQHHPILSIFNQLLASGGEDKTSLISHTAIKDIKSTAITGHGEWGRIGIFYPQNHSDMLDWLLFALQQRAKELGITGGMELAIRSSYSTENIISSAFKIANLCDNRKLKGAVILGPSIDECDPSVRENFYDIMTHMLEIMLIRCGVINFEDAALPSTYVKTLAELLK